MELKFIVEAILFSAPKPMNAAELRDILVTAAERAEEPEVKSFKKTKAGQIEEVLEQLSRDHAQLGRSYRITCVAGSWQFVSEPEYAPWLRVVAGEKPRPPRLSQPALETLAIIAYRQPLTRAEIEQIRGVSVDGVMQTLLERGLVAAIGRAEVVGRPITYGTAPQFLDYFGLRNLDELPAADELRRVEVKKPEGLMTVDPGLATVPPEALTAASAEGEPALGPGAGTAAETLELPLTEAPAAESFAAPPEPLSATEEVGPDVPVTDQPAISSESGDGES